VQVDDEQSALGSHRPIDLGVLGDCRQTAVDALAQLEADRQGYRTPEVSASLAHARWWNDTVTPDLSTSERIDPRELSRVLDELLPAERVVSVDSGNFMGYPSAYLRVPDQHGFCFTQAFQSIGLGLASGIGAALAQPHRLAVVGTGDGGFLMGISELETLVRIGIPAVVVVYDDAAYGAEVHHFGATPTWRPWPAGSAPTASRCVPPPTSTWYGSGSGPHGVSSSSMPRSPATAVPGGWRRRSRATDPAASDLLVETGPTTSRGSGADPSGRAEGRWLSHGVAQLGDGGVRDVDGPTGPQPTTPGTVDGGRCPLASR